MWWYKEISLTSIPNWNRLHWPVNQAAENSSTTKWLKDLCTFRVVTIQSECLCHMKLAFSFGRFSVLNGNECLINESAWELGKKNRLWLAFTSVDIPWLFSVIAYSLSLILCSLGFDLFCLYSGAWFCWYVLSIQQTYIWSLEQIIN